MHIYLTIRMNKAWLSLMCIIFCSLSIKLVKTSNSCWRRPPCTCSGTNRTTVNCRNVQNVSDVIELFKSRSPMYKIRIQGNFTTIESKVFENISVSVLWVMSPLKSDIPTDSLLGIQNLKILILNTTLFQTIPQAFSNEYFVEFESIYGKLTSIKTELQNMSSAVEIRLKMNMITTISPEAFHGTENLNLIDLSYNKLVYIHPKTFETLLFLEAIYLQHNYLLSIDGCFHGLNPKMIDLYGNNLTSIENVLHSGMWNLKYLNIGSNPGMEISSHSFNRSLKSLSDLHMSSNEYTELDPHLLKRLISLHKLYLNNNNLTFLPRYFFENNPHLSTLTLRNNRLTSIEEAMKNRKEWFNWISIWLDGNNLKRISFGSETTNILLLDVSRNEISHIKKADMVALEKIVHLNLSQNALKSVERESFRNLNALKVLDLSYNHLERLNHSLQDLPNLSTLSLSSVFLEILSKDDFVGLNKLKNLYLHNNNLQSVSGAFKYLKNLGMLDLSMNNLTTLTVESFPSFWNTSLRIKVLWMEGNPWTCDCRLAWMADWVQKRGTVLKDEPVCASPFHLQNQTLRSLNQTDYEIWFEECPDSCECICQWDGKEIYTKANCTQRGLKEIPKIFPRNVRLLDISWNEIESFSSAEIFEFKNLEHLNLEHNYLHEMQIIIFPSRMSSLLLAYNQLHTFPVDVWITANTSQSQISLSYNPWVCDCNAWSFRNWIIQEKKIIIDADEIRCGKEESFYLKNKLISSLTKKELCSLLSYVIILSICLVLLLIFAVLIFCYRHSLISLLYSWGCECLKSSERHEYPYDIFLMYCEDDEQFAQGELTKGLENSKYSFNLCIPSRDISEPRTQQKINAYLPQCTKVLILLTRSFIENQDCMRFLISAMSFSTESSAKCIIFVIKGELPHPHEFNPILKTLMRICICLRWGECLFWKKLVYQLPKKLKKAEEWDSAEQEYFLRS